MKAKDIMTTRVVTVGPDEPVTGIAQKLTDHHISAVPVVEEGKVVGLISRANIIREIASATAVTIDTDADDEGGSAGRSTWRCRSSPGRATAPPA